MIKALVIVAHPDDETIWMGGSILKYKNWDWTIFSLTRKSDNDRRVKFKKVCKYLNAKSIMTDLDDEKLLPVRSKEIIEIIKNNLPEVEYDYIFTHGKNGEYGHLRHKEIHKAVTKMIKNNLLNTKQLYYFSYVPGKQISPHSNDLKIPVPNKKANTFVNLNNHEFKQKFRIVTELYGFTHPIFETLSCNEKEAFLKLK